MYSCLKVESPCAIFLLISTFAPSFLSLDSQPMSTALMVWKMRPISKIVVITSYCKHWLFWGFL